MAWRQELASVNSVSPLTPTRIRAAFAELLAPSPGKTDPYGLNRRHARYLAEMLSRPTRYTLRSVEQLTFVPTGGQRWTRSLQIQFPVATRPGGSRMRVVSLGQFSRRRFADFEVRDSTGFRLTLLTRRQHGIALTKAVLTKHCYALPAEHLKFLETDREARVSYGRLRDALYEHFTQVGDLTGEQIKHANRMTQLFETLLIRLNVKGVTLDSRVTLFATEFVAVMDTTRYLCWIRAAPGEIVGVTATYTTRDPRHLLGRGTARDKLETLRQGLSPGAASQSRIWHDWFRQFGQAPLNYEFSIPSQRHAGSYYFTIAPPDGSSVTYLDWETGNSFTSEAVDCSLHSAHIHYDDPAPIHKGGEGAHDRGRAIRAYVRCKPTDHKLIVGTALLNAAFVVLIAIGHIPARPGSTTQNFVLAAPSILLAYLARQQRHYYADAMRRQRGIMWGYVAVSVVCLLVLNFFQTHDSIEGSRLSWPAAVVTCIWGAASIGIALWYLPLGSSYERVTETQMRRALSRSTQAPWKSYSDTIQRYARGILTGAVAGAVCMLIFCVVAIGVRKPGPHHARTVIITVPPGSLCEGCSLDLRKSAGAEPF